jgi:hypothetical protein
MKLDELIQKINTSAEELNFGMTRTYIEHNYELLKENKHLLNSNARDILTLVLERTESGYPPLSRPEMSTINSINTYAKKFNIKGIKLAVKSNPKLFSRPEITDYFNQDAKIILVGMGVIKEDSK